MAWGTMAVDWETRVDYDRLRKYRVQRAQEQLEKNKIGAFLFIDSNNIRYTTGIHIGEWARDKFVRYALLPRGQDPIMFESGSAAAARKLYSPWIADRVRPAISYMRGGTPKYEALADQLAVEIRNILADYGLEKEPLGIDWTDMILPAALHRAGIETIVDATSPMLDARLIKSPDEIQLLKTAATLVDAAYESLVRAIRPGIRENELVAVAADTLYRLGSEDLECVNVVSGSRGSPHPHTFSDRILRPNEFVFFDVIHAFNGYRTCYYRTFFCGKPTAEQKEAYQLCYKWVKDAIDVVKPGATTADIARVWPTCETWGFKNEREAMGMAVGHGIGVSIHERPTISRLYSLDEPFTLQEGMVIALETYAQTPGGKDGVRIEEEVVVTKDGHEVITRYPCNELVCCSMPTFA